MAQSKDPDTRDIMLGTAETSAARCKAALPALVATLTDADEVQRRRAVWGFSGL